MTPEIDAVLMWLKSLDQAKALYYGEFLAGAVKDMNEAIKAELKAAAGHNGEVVEQAMIDGKTVYWQVTIGRQEASEYTVKREAKEVRSIRMKFAEEVDAL